MSAGEYLLGILGGTIIGLSIGIPVGESQKANTLQNEFSKNAKAKEITLTDIDGTPRTDTLVMFNLNASEDLRRAVMPAIKDGKIKVQKLTP